MSYLAGPKTINRLEFEVRGRSKPETIRRAVSAKPRDHAANPLQSVPSPSPSSALRQRFSPQDQSPFKTVPSKTSELEDGRGHHCQDDSTETFRLQLSVGRWEYQWKRRSTTFAIKASVYFTLRSHRPFDQEETNAGSKRKTGQAYVWP